MATRGSIRHAAERRGNGGRHRGGGEDGPYVRGVTAGDGAGEAAATTDDVADGSGVEGAARTACRRGGGRGAAIRARWRVGGSERRREGRPGGGSGGAGKRAGVRCARCPSQLSVIFRGCSLSWRCGGPRQRRKGRLAPLARFSGLSQAPPIRRDTAAAGTGQGGGELHAVRKVPVSPSLFEGLSGTVSAWPRAIARAEWSRWPAWCWRRGETS